MWTRPHPLTDNPAAIHDWGGWAPGGTRSAYAANDRDEVAFDVYVQDIAGGERTRAFQGSFPGIVSISGFRPDDAALTLLYDRSYGDMSLHLLDLGSGEARPFPQPRGCKHQSVRWAADGRTLLALTDHGDGDFLRLCRLDPDSGAVNVVYEAPGGDVEAWATTRDGGILATIENDRGYVTLRIGPRDGTRAAVADLPHCVIAEPKFSPDETRLAFTVSAPTLPPSLWLSQDGVAKLVWQPRPAIDPASFAGCELVDWHSFDRTSIQGWLVLPHSEKPRGGHPAVVWVHGGLVSQSRANFRLDMQVLLACGFAVLRLMR